MRNWLRQAVSLERELAHHMHQCLVYWHFCALWQAVTTLAPLPVTLTPLTYSWWDGVRSPTAMTLMLRRRVIEILSARRGLGIVTDHMTMVEHVDDARLITHRSAFYPLMRHAWARVEARQWWLLLHHPPTVLPPKFRFQQPESYEDMLLYLGEVAWAFRWERVIGSFFRLGRYVPARGSDSK